MKRLFWLTLIVAVLTVSAMAADGITWDMYTADNAQWSLSGCVALTDGGTYYLQSTSGDMQIKTTLDSKAFNSADYPYFAIKYKAVSANREAAIFWTNDTYPSYTGDAVAKFNMNVEGVWTTTVVDMREIEKLDGSWSGTAKNIRFDPINDSNIETNVTISRIGFFATAEAAQAYMAQGAEKDLSMDTEEEEEDVVVDLTNLDAIIWDMTLPGNALLWGVGGGMPITGEDNTFGIQSTGRDVKITALMDGEGFSAAEYPYFGMKAKISATSPQAAIFWTNDTFPSFTGNADAIFGVSVDNSWAITVIDLREKEKYDGTWAETIKSIRLDPVNDSTEDTVINISRMGFFKTQQEAKAWLELGAGEFVDPREKEVDATWNFAEQQARDSWTIVGGESTVEAGVYYVRANTTDLTMSTQLGEKQFHALKYPYFAIKYKSNAKNKEAVVFWTNSTFDTFTGNAVMNYTTVNDGKWHDLVLDARIFEKYPDTWDGVITSVRVDPVNPSTLDCSMYIAAIGFFETQEEAKDFLESIEIEGDYDHMNIFRDNMQVSYIPGGVLSDGYNKADYLVKDVNAKGNVVMYKDANGVEKVVPISHVNEKGFISFSPNVAADYYLGTGGKQYVDTPNHWAKEYIDYTSARSLFGGTSPTEFSPEEKMTRGMFVTVLGRLCGVSDSTSGMYYDSHINWAIGMGYADVNTAAAFRPEDPITRLEMAKFINNYLNDNEYDMTKAKYPAFADTASLSADEKAAVENARAYGIINGKENNMFDPKGILTRAETSTVMTRLIKTMLGINVSTAYSPDYFTRDRIKLGTKANFDPNQVDDEYLQYVADLGLDWLVTTPATSNSEVRNKILNFADANGIEVYLEDTAILSDYNADAEYYFHPSYTGTYVDDEPGTETMPAVAQKANEYLAKTGRHPHVNLLPMYSNAAQLKYGASAAKIEHYDADPDLYYNHVATWAGMSDAKLMSVDIYPLYADKNKPTYANYVESINVFARVAREYDKEFVAYIQAVGWQQSMREPTEADFRWQIYSMLSFGCKGFVYWHYWIDTPGYKDYGMVERDGTPTHIYYAAKPTVEELKKLSDVYCAYENIGAYNVNCTDQTPYLRMTNPVEFTAIDVQTTSPLLVGCFEAKQGNGKAFTLVNMNDPTWNMGANVSFTLNGYTKATAYIKGEPVELTANNGVFNVSLECGQGIFVTIE